ncbi:MAG: hypothetical protein HW408_102, partial [Actinobacteria bacterium]|nr:hypothetical protein [Actinomycetota bacterium]
MKVDIERQIQQSAEETAGKIRDLLAARKVFS